MKRLVITAFVLFIAMSSRCSETARPWTFWYWMYGAVSKPGIKADLQAMKDVGLGGCYLMPIRGVSERPEYEGKAQQLSPAFWQMVDYAFAQADSLGLEMGIHVCDGFALAGGPWITPEESMQKVVWSDTIASLLQSPPVAPGEYYEDIAAFNCPVWGDNIAPATITGTIVRDEKETFRSKEPGYIQYNFDEPQTVRSLRIVPSGNNLQAQRLLVQASDDGTAFRHISQLMPPRQGWQNTDEAYTYALPETTARHFRFCWTPEGTEPGSEDLDAAKWSPVLKIKELTLSAEPRIDQYESKNGSVWRIPANAITPVTPVITPATPVSYRPIRFGHTTTGHTNATAGGGKGLECDKFSAAAVNKQIDHWFGEFKKRPHADVVKYMHVDSWECGSQNWSRNFAEEFHKRRGYDLLPFMPVYAGIPVDDMAEAKALGLSSDDVLRDIRKTINELIGEVFFATVAQKAKDYGVLLSCESVAPTMVSDGMEHYRYADLPMGEFWLNSPTHDKPNDMLDAISGAHVYGKNIIQAEGFTEVRGVWDETPASIKPLLDRNFCLGMNRLFFHVFTHNPWTDRRPGMTLDGIGLFFQRDQTWFPEAKALVDYVTRCQKLLQRGKPVVDIAVFTGEEMPRRALTPDKLVPMLPGLFGAERVAAERERLANHGLPMEESPVGVRHNANILDLKDWVNPLHGYHYDSMNPDGLSRWTSKYYDPVDDDMPNYRVLVVPKGTKVSEASQQKIDSLERCGITVITEPWLSDTLPGLPRDVVLPEGIAFTHRKAGKTNYYFLSNQTDSVCTFQAKFRIDSNVTELVNPLTGAPMTFREQREGEYSCVDITLQKHGSVFVMAGFHILDARRESQNRQYSKPLGEKLKWEVTFRENGETVKTRQLFDWSQSDNDRIRYFSGHARYTTALKLKKDEVPQGRAWLSMPNVKDIAHVWVNGQDCGIAWTAPYEVEISGALKKGKNKIEIEVVNTWHNALRGMDQGKPPYDGIWTNAKYRTQGDNLLPAGLLGPIELKTTAP